ncbi:MAG TPA: peptidoglycan editing factor PgeF [Terriglobia bacterium]|nr:peptidoglycan editing factor PgeF [Terriglobia bacterium]
MKRLEATKLARARWVLHAFSTRIQGVSRAPAAGLNLGYVEGDQRKNVERNRERFFRALGAGQFPLAELRQIHSTLVYQVVRGKRGKLEYRPSGYPNPPGSRPAAPAGDALLTQEPGVLLSVRGADCMPVLLADPRQRAVAAIHAGWRGALAGAVEKTVGEMVRIFGSRPNDLLAAVGPSIRACCYQVGDEVVTAFCGRYPNGESFFRPAPHDKVEEDISRRYPLLFLSKQPPGHGPESVPTIHLDLAAVARHQLRSAGLMNSKIQVADFCTACRTDIFFSHRQEGGRTGRMMAVIGIRS